MNIYWCYDYHENWGVFVVAKTRGRAKVLGAAEMDIRFTDVRSWVVRKNVKEKTEGVIEFGSPLLLKYKLEYDVSEEWL